MTASTSTLALIAAITAEQVAAYGYGTLGPQVTGGGSLTLARDCERAHQQLAASALNLVTGSSGASPSTIAPSTYLLPTTPVDNATAQRLAVQLEQACANAWRYALAQLAQAPRDAGAASLWMASATALSDSAVRAVRWRRLSDPASASDPFPGI